MEFPVGTKGPPVSLSQGRELLTISSSSSKLGRELTIKRKGWWSSKLQTLTREVWSSARPSEGKENFSTRSSETKRELTPGLVRKDNFFLASSFTFWEVFLLILRRCRRELARSEHGQNSSSLQNNVQVFYLILDMKRASSQKTDRPLQLHEKQDLRARLSRQEATSFCR